MKRCIVFFFACFLTRVAIGQIITTVAGDSLSGYNGDDIPAIGAMLSGPYSTAIDAAGNIYIADLYNNRVRKVNGAGIITTIAGTGVAGYSGDDSAATTAKLNGPVDVAVDGSGNVYIADDYNSRVRKVNTSGIITTIAGTGAFGFGGDNGPATVAILYGPHGLAFDAAGNLYICDDLNNRIRKINSSGIITTIAGTGFPGYSGDGNAATSAEITRPYGIALDVGGNVYVADLANTIRKISTSGTISTVAGNGTAGYNGDGILATTAELNQPFGVAVDREDNVYVADNYNNRVRKINSAGIISTYAGTGTEGYSGDNGPAVEAKLYTPLGVTVDASGDLYIADYGNGHIRFVRNTESVNNIKGIESNICIFPNPSSGLFTVDVISPSDREVMIVITSVLGEKIKEFSAHTNHSFEINMDEPTGIYFLTITTKHSTFYRKNTDL